MEGIKFSVQGVLNGRGSWLDLARSVEASGFESLYVPDHPGAAGAPFVALAAAATVTTQLRLGTCMLNAGVWHPMDLANALATLDLASDGRATLGVGAGHNPVEWTQTGQAFPPAGARVDRMIELVDVVQALLAGEEVTHRGLLRLDRARLSQPRPLQRAIPLIVGGNGERVVRFAAERADRVGITGFGRTLTDGDHHRVDWSPSGVDRTIETVRSAADAAGRSPEVEALVQHVEITGDAERAAVRLARFIEGATPDDLLTAPYVLVGTEPEILAEVRRHRERLGITSYVVRAPMVEAITPVVASLVSTWP